MATSRYYISFMNVASVVLILSLFSLPLNLGESDFVNFKLKVKMTVGSSPPKCVNKCSGCKPCMAALVVSPPLEASSYVRDESYYLLSWKCKCRNKYYQP